MPRVSAGTREYLGWGCTCPSRLKENQILKGMARAAIVTVKFQQEELDGTKVWHAWTDPDHVYRVTFHPLKEGKRCKHAMACAADVVGNWLLEGFIQLRKEQAQCQQAKKEVKKLQKNLVKAARAMLQVKPMMPSDTS